jgi:hypothetical protein
MLSCLVFLEILQLANICNLSILFIYKIVSTVQPFILSPYIFKNLNVQILALAQFLKL